MLRKTVGTLIVASVMMAGCAETGGPVSGDTGMNAASAYAAKVVNSPEDADEETMLLMLSEELVQELGRGASDLAFEEACEDTGVKHLERLFVSDNAIARSKGLHRWYVVTFEDRQNPSAVAERFASVASVEHVQFNTVVQRNYGSEGTPYRYEPKAYGEFELPYNDPLLPDQWHYINNVDLSVAQTSREGADINVKEAWKLCAGDPEIIVAVCDEGVKYTHPDLIDNMWVNAG